MEQTQWLASMLFLGSSFQKTSSFLEEYFKAFNVLREEGIWFIGEMPWVFADFMTKQEPRRVAGNRKGLFTRQGQPKAAAHTLRRRYLGLL